MSDTTNDITIEQIGRSWHVRVGDQTVWSTPNRAKADGLAEALEYYGDAAAAIAAQAAAWQR